MIILAIDLTSAHGSLAIRANGETRGELRLESADGFGHLLFPAIDRLLQQTPFALQDVDCFAGASGPGAFTGVRVGLTAIKGLAEAQGCPVAGISNLRALSTFGKGRQRAVLINARRGDIFGALYGADSELILEETVGKLSPWLASLPPDVDEFITQEPGLLAGHDLPVIAAPLYLAEAVARCAELDAARNRWLDPAALDANYVRRSDAELFWRET